MADKYGTSQLEVGDDDDETVPIYEITCEDEDSDYVSSQSDANSDNSLENKETKNKFGTTLEAEFRQRIESIEKRQRRESQGKKDGRDSKGHTNSLAL